LADAITRHQVQFRLWAENAQRLDSTGRFGPDGTHRGGDQMAEFGRLSHSIVPGRAAAKLLGRHPGQGRQVQRAAAGESGRPAHGGGVGFLDRGGQHRQPRSA
jgi:hypothetical protein